MKTIITSIVLVIATLFVSAQDLYTKAFGSNKDKPVIFLHGGPGYNSVNFEATTARPMADKGFYVIVYDRRGEGRSKDLNAPFTFSSTIDDLTAIYKRYGLTKSTLIGHSFGGVVATLFAEKYPEKVQSVILVGAPVSMQESFKTILSASKTIYETKKDSSNLRYLSMLENMDKNSIEYSSYCFMHAMQNGFYSPKNPSAEAKAIYSKFRTDSLLIKYASQMSTQAPQGFWKNEKYTSLDLTANLKNVQSKGIKVYGLYGMNDGLYSSNQVKALQSLLGSTNLKYFDNCSHSVFIDQQAPFIASVQEWVK